MNLQFSALRRLCLLGLTFVTFTGLTKPANAFWTQTAYII